MNKKLKVLALVLVVLLVGCSSKKEYANEKEALEAYVATINKINEKESYGINLDGNFEVPKSAISKTEVKGDLKIDGYASKDLSMDFDVNVKTGNEDVKMKVLSDSKYIYIETNGTWQKTKLDSSTFDKINPSKVTTYEDAKEQFDSYEDKSYEKTTVDGKEGYKISYVMGLDSLKKAADTKDQTEDQKEAMKQLKGLKIKGEMFVPITPSDSLKQNIQFNINMFGVKVNFEADIDLKSSDNKKITIPDKAKKAVEGQNNMSSFA